MESIRAFVGHSFSDEDSNVVTSFLRCLDAIKEIHPSFEWEHAEHPEPRVVDEKVLARFEGKNLFVGICTRKEMVIASEALSKPWYSRGQLQATIDAFKWKTSDWIIQEIGLAVGRGLHVILLLEEQTRLPGSLQGNLEYINFSRDAPEKAHQPLMGMVAALTPKKAVDALVPSQVVPPIEKDPEPVDILDSQWDVPKDDWVKRDYDFALMHQVAVEKPETEELINKAFLASSDGATERGRLRWNAWRIYCRLVFKKESKLSELRELAEKGKDESDISDYLGRSYLYYQEWSLAATAFEHAASVASSAAKRIKLLCEAVIAARKAGDGSRSLSLSSKMRGESDGSTEVEVVLLEAERRVAVEEKNDDATVASMERLLALKPDDHEVRFSLAYKHSQLDRDELAIYHYLRIPEGERTAIAWNNLGVSLSRLGLAIRSIDAYRKAKTMGETLAMSNLARELLDAGFQDEAREILVEGLAVPDHHENIDSAYVALRAAPEKEREKEDLAREKAHEVSDFYRSLGHAMTTLPSEALVGRWKHPKCVLNFVVQGDQVNAEGSYEEQRKFGLMSLASIGVGARDQPPVTYVIRCEGSRVGQAVFGRLTTKKADEAPKATASMLLLEEPSPTVLMWLNASSNQLQVLERTGSGAPTFYALTRV